MKLIPAILSKTPEDFAEKARLAESFTDYAQIDFMDGRFVPAKSVSVDAVRLARPGFQMEAHLMVENPLSYLDDLRGAGFRRLYFHIEAPIRANSFIERARALGLEVGIALRPETEVSAINKLVDEVEAVLFLTVQPGNYGDEFIPAVLGKMKAFKRSHAGKSFGVNGGVRLENLGAIVEAKPDFVTVGSAIFNAPDPAAAYREFNQRIAGADI